MQVAIEEITRLVSRQLGIRKVSPESLLREDLGAESLDIQNLVMTLEDKYGLTIDDEAIAGLQTVADIHALCG